jgi:chorismate mutase/prephenate dehydratase
MNFTTALHFNCIADIISSVKMCINQEAEMDLIDLRNQINDIDKDILNLFIKRMEVCKNIAEYKKEHSLPVFQNNREKEIIDRITDMSPDNLKNGAALLFTSIMDISKCLQQDELLSDKAQYKAKSFEPEKAEIIACQGTSGAYSEKACRKLFKNQKIRFYKEFEDVFKAVDNDEVDFGILPLQNSTIGSVSQTYDLMAKYNFYINAIIRVEISHCLAAKNGTKLSDIKEVYSIEPALSQCSRFLSENRFERKEYLNTALSAKLVSESDEPIACICSEEAAKLFGLEIIADNIADAYPNYTRFICISKQFISSENAGTISVSLSIPHTKSSLYRLLTKFSVSGMNLVKIENKPIAGKEFEVIFYLDFSGNCMDRKVSALLDELSKEHSYFKFLGNFDEII